MKKHNVHIDGTRFRDAHGRHLILRGVNLGGDTKVPAKPDGRTFLPTDFTDHRTVCFIGRPAPLESIDAHLDRIVGWGFNVVRLLTTWEAVEHAGPGLYDEAYIAYYAEVCRRAARRGLHVFVDFHQDAWSRLSGGSGAPGWTFEAAGLDHTRFDAADAAHVMQHRYDPRVGGIQPGYPPMSWGGNYRMPANGIMWTLFFAGADFAPACCVDGINIQHYLQSHYLAAMQAVAKAVANIDLVIGFDTLNEPGEGYIGRDLSEKMSRYHGQAWSPLDGLAVASGLTRQVATLEVGGSLGKTTLAMNTAKQSIWLPGRQDPFLEAGVWSQDAHGEVVALRPDHFQRVGDRTVQVSRDYMAPFFEKVARTVRSVRPDWLLFLEVEPFNAALGDGLPSQCPPDSVNACHWYDISALATKRFDPASMRHILTGEVRHGEAAIEAGYESELTRMKGGGERLNGGAPTLIGEFGIPFDLNGSQAYGRWESGERSPEIWRAQASALTLMYNAMDSLLLSSTQWNYTASNANDPMIGDGWNQEDLSIFSSDQMEGDDALHSGARALEGFCRPFVRASQGDLLWQRFERLSSRFVATVAVDLAVDAPTEIYLPRHVFGATPAVSVSDGTFEWDAARQLLSLRATRGGCLFVSIRKQVE